MVGSQLHRPSQITLRFREIVFPQVQCSQVVVSLGRIRLRLDYLAERCRRLLQITALKKGYSVSEFVPMKGVGVQLAFERERFFKPLCWSARNHLHVLYQSRRI